jgi:hypothetical protein
MDRFQEKFFRVGDRVSVGADRQAREPVEPAVENLAVPHVALTDFGRGRTVAAQGGVGNAAIFGGLGEAEPARRDGRRQRHDSLL